MLNSIISSTGITVSSFFICTAVSLVLGLGAAFLAMYKAKYSRSFVLTLAALPAMVQIVIMMVNGNLNIVCGKPVTKDVTQKTIERSCVYETESNCINPGL